MLELDIAEQLRRYGEAVERWLPDDVPVPEPEDQAAEPEDLAGRVERRPLRRHLGRRGRAVTVAVLGTAAAMLLGAIVLWPEGGSDDDVRTDVPPIDRDAPNLPPATEAPTTTTQPTPSTTDSASAPTTAPDGPDQETGGSNAQPGPDTTGPTDPSVLVPKTGEEIEAMMQPGAVIENVDITGGHIDVVAEDVTIRNFRLDAGGAPFGFRSCGTDGDCKTAGDQKAGFVLEDGEIFNTSVAAFRGYHSTLRRLEVHDSDGGGFVPLTGVTIEGSWWHHLGRGEDASANGIRFQGGGSGISVRNNYCDMPVTVPPPYNSSACVLAGSNTDQSLSASIEGNWFNGGNHTVQCNNQRGITVQGNRFGRDYRRGPMVRCPSSSGNVWDDTGEEI